MNDKQKAAYKIMAEEMDKIDNAKILIKDYFMKYGELPEGEHYKKTFDAFMKDRFRKWRDIPKVVKRLKRAAKRAGKNE